MPVYFTFIFWIRPWIKIVLLFIFSDGRPCVQKSHFLEISQNELRTLLLPGRDLHYSYTDYGNHPSSRPTSFVHDEVPQKINLHGAEHPNVSKKRKTRHRIERNVLGLRELTWDAETVDGRKCHTGVTFLQYIAFGNDSIHGSKPQYRTIAAVTRNAFRISIDALRATGWTPAGNTSTKHFPNMPHVYWCSWFIWGHLHEMSRQRLSLL